MARDSKNARERERECERKIKFQGTRHRPEIKKFFFPIFFLLFKHFRTRIVAALIWRKKNEFFKIDETWQFQ